MPPNPQPPASSIIIIVSPDAQQQAQSRRCWRIGGAAWQLTAAAVCPAAAAGRGGHSDLLLRGKIAVAERGSGGCHRPAAAVVAGPGGLEKGEAAEMDGVIRAYPDLFISPTPRRRLGYRTPAEILANAALRWQCEPAFRRKPECRLGGRHGRIRLAPVGGRHPRLGGRRPDVGLRAAGGAGGGKGPG